MECMRWYPNLVKLPEHVWCYIDHLLLLANDNMNQLEVPCEISRLCYSTYLYSSGRHLIMIQIREVKSKRYIYLMSWCLIKQHSECRNSLVIANSWAIVHMMIKRFHLTFCKGPWDLLRLPFESEKGVDKCFIRALF